MVRAGVSLQCQLTSTGRQPMNHPRQVCDLSLVKAVDMCKASEAAGRQLKAMSETDPAHALHSSMQSGA